MEARAVKRATLRCGSKQGACQPLRIETNQQTAPREAAALAPPWHTAALVAVMLAVAITGSLLQRAAPPPVSAALPGSSSTRIWQQYLPLLLVNGLLVLYVARLFRTRNALSDLVGRLWRRPADAAIDAAFAVLAFALIVAIEALTAPLFAGRNAAVTALLPSTGAERLTWLFVASVVGACEELVYRGYLQTQLGAFTRSATLGLVLQAALFGLAHLEQGAGSALRIAVYGLGFGLLALRRASLLPGILCHVGIDVASGLLN